MTLLTAPDDRDLQTGNEPAAPMLRLRRAGDMQERSLPLSAGKCTVGSSPQCQVCLPSPDVRPLQCLITLEANAALVTRWAAGVQLNGRDFSKASLSDGDRLTIGSWELQFDRGRGSSFDAAPGVDDRLTLDEQVEEVINATKSIWDLNAREETPAASTPTVPGLAADGVSDIQPKATAAPAPNNVSLPEIAAAQAFEASLVQHLWTANHQARRRAKALINGIRAARFHADAMAADLSAMETELDLARAAYDSHLVNDDRLQRELAEQRRQHEERLAPLQAEIEILKADLETARAALAKQIDEYERIAIELTAAQEASAAPAVDQAALSRAAELEAALVTQSRQLEAITLELQAAQEEQQRLTQLYVAETERAAALQDALAEMEVAAERAAATPDAGVAVPEQLQPAVDVWQGVQPVDERTPVETSPSTSWTAFEPALEAPAVESTDAAEIEMASEPDAAAWALPAAADALDEPAAPAPVACDDPAEPVVTELPTVTNERPTIGSTPVKQPELPTPPKAETPAWAAAPAEKPATEYSSTSFIDKYRHLLDDDDASSSPLPGRGGPVIDDEFLSPAKAQTCASPADESDEALEAYMANMMRRVKSSSSSFANDPPARTVQEPIASAVSRFVPSGSEPAEVSPQPESDFVSEEPLSFEELKQATRKVPLASDLAALREIANSTARTAIATHTHRQSRETAITKIVVAITAMVSAGYLMASAPALDTWQFWAGAGTCAVGIVAAVQVLVLERRGRRPAASR